MLSEEQINYHANGCCTSGECNIGRKALADEIKRLRAERDGLLTYCCQLSEELSRYKTPNVDNIEVKP